MSKIEINPIEEENLTVNVEDIPEGIKMNIIGSIDMQQPNVILTPLFNDIHDQILSSKIKLVEIDIKKLKFMNSSGIGTLIKWFVKLPSLSGEEKYKIRILYNNSISWQKKGLEPLLSLAPDQVELVGG